MIITPKRVRKLWLLSPFIDPILRLFCISRICLPCSLKVSDQPHFLGKRLDSVIKVLNGLGSVEKWPLMKEICFKEMMNELERIHCWLGTKPSHQW